MKRSSIFLFVFTFTSLSAFSFDLPTKESSRFESKGNWEISFFISPIISNRITKNNIDTNYNIQNYHKSGFVDFNAGVHYVLSKHYQIQSGISYLTFGSKAIHVLAFTELPLGSSGFQPVSIKTYGKYIALPLTIKRLFYLSPFTFNTSIGIWFNKFWYSGDTPENSDNHSYSPPYIYGSDKFFTWQLSEGVEFNLRSSILFLEVFYNRTLSDRADWLSHRDFGNRYHIAYYRYGINLGIKFSLRRSKS